MHGLGECQRRTTSVMTPRGVPVRCKRPVRHVLVIATVHRERYSLLEKLGAKWVSPQLDKRFEDLQQTRDSLTVLGLLG